MPVLVIVTLSQSLLSEPQFGHLSNDVDHTTSPGNLEQHSRIDLRVPRVTLESAQSWAHSRGLMYLYFGLHFTFPSSWVWEPLKNDGDDLFIY